MAITLTFTDEQLGGDIDLQGSTEGVISYDPKPPASEGAMSVTDTVVLYIDSGAKAARTTNGYLHRLERFFERARRRQKLKTGLKVWVKYKPYDADTLFRSEVLDGRIVWATDTTRPAWLPSDKGECAIIFTRRAYWEHDTEQELPLANDNDSGTGGIPVQNHNDGGDNNWVIVEGTNVVGSLPAPIRFELQNDGGAQPNKRFWLCHTVETDDGSATNQVWALEGEDNEIGVASPTVSASSSNGEYLPIQWTATTETEVFRITLDNTYLVYAGGNPFRAIARVVSMSYSNLYLRLAISDSAGFGEIWSSQTVLATANDQLIDFGAIPAIPPQPGSLDVSAYTTHYLSIYATRAQSGTHTLNLDVIHMFPIDGGFRYLNSTGGWGVDNALYLTDDGIEGYTYRGQPGGTQWAMFVGNGDYLRVVPGRTQRISMLWADKNMGAQASLAGVVRMYYRPRRASF